MKTSQILAPDRDSTYGMMVEAADLMRRNPQRWKLVHPRRYAEIPGYINPRLNSGLMAIYLEFMNQPKPNKVEIDAILSTWQICKSLVPTFFVGKEFSEALVHTEPPDNLVIHDLKWPFDGMVFALHQEFQWQYFHRAVPFIRIANHPTGRQRAPEIVRQAYPDCLEFGISEYKFDQTAFIITATAMFGDKPVDYSASFPDSESIGSMMNDQEYQVFTVDQQSIDEMGITDDNNREQDMAFLKKIIALAAHLLLAMNAVPEQIEAPTPRWPTKERVQRRTPKEEWVWHPHFLGRQYRWQHDRDSQGGTHASPRLHPRRGHWRHQPYGPGRAKKKVIWIKPLLIGAKPERIDDAKAT